MTDKKTDLDEYRRFIGYLILSFISVFIYLPLIWFISLWKTQSGLYIRWGISSILMLFFNIVFYQLRLPNRWTRNLSIAAGVDIILLLMEYYWLFTSL